MLAVKGETPAPNPVDPEGAVIRSLRRTALVLTALLVHVPALGAQEPARAELSGRVLEAGAERGIGGVTVEIVDLGWRTVTDRRGRFRVRHLPPGRHRIRVEHLGYASRTRSVGVEPGRTLGVRIRLDPSPVEARDLVVTVRTEDRAGRLVDEGFYWRRDRYAGHFYGPQHLTEWSTLDVGTLLHRTPGLRVFSDPVTGAFTIRNRRCRGATEVYVDGQQWPAADLNMPLSEVAAIEVYRGQTQLIDLRHGTGRCGAVLVWTWSGPNPFLAGGDGEPRCPAEIERRPRITC